MYIYVNIVYVYIRKYNSNKERASTVTKPKCTCRQFFCICDPT